MWDIVDYIYYIKAFEDQYKTHLNNRTNLLWAKDLQYNNNLCINLVNYHIRDKGRLERKYLLGLCNSIGNHNDLLWYSDYLVKSIKCINHTMYKLYNFHCTFSKNNHFSLKNSRISNHMCYL